MRPDGSRIAFRPYPTPLFDEDGKLHRRGQHARSTSREEQSEALSEQADRCRRLADAMYNRDSREVLETMADGFERTAAELTLDAVPTRLGGAVSILIGGISTIA